MTSLRRIASFVARVFDRRSDDNVNNVRNDVDAKSTTLLPPFTFEAFAEGLSDWLSLFSADLLRIENIVQVLRNYKKAA